MTDEAQGVAGQDALSWRRRQIAIWIAIGLAFILVGPCAPWIQASFFVVGGQVLNNPGLHRATVERNLERWFPGFRIASLEKYKVSMEWNPLASGGGPRSGFHFVLESRDVKGFRLRGDYPTYGHHSQEEAQRELKENMFNGRLFSRQESLALQREVVRLVPGDTVLIDAGSWLDGVQIEPGTPREESGNYELMVESGWLKFRLDPDRRSWKLLDFVQADSD